MHISYRQKLTIIITTLSVVFTSVCLFFFYQYTYDTVLSSLTKNLKDAVGISRASLDDSDIARIKRLKNALSPYIKYSENEIKAMQEGGTLNNIPKDVINILQASDDFQYLATKLTKQGLETIHDGAQSAHIFDYKKTMQYIADGAIMPYLVILDDKYSDKMIVQNLVSPVHRPLPGWPGNPIGTSWHTVMSEKYLNHYPIYVHNAIYTDIYYSSLFCSAAIMDKSGKIIAYLETEYPTGKELNKLTKLKYISYMLVFLSFILSLAVSLSVSKRMSKSLKKLSHASEEIRKNNYDVIVDIPNKDEFGKLGNTFNSMTASIKKSTNELQVSNDRLMSITADMHDGVGAVLTSIKVSTRNKDNPDLESIHNLANQGMAEIRFLIDAMEFDKCTCELLAEGINLLAVDILQPQKIIWQMEVDGNTDIELPFTLYLDIQRMAREAFANIIKHSTATECHIWLGVENDTITMTIRNNGTQRTEPLAPSRGKGLVNTSHRVARYNGTFDTQKTEEGFIFNVSVKIPPNPNA